MNKKNAYLLICLLASSVTLLPSDSEGEEVEMTSKEEETSSERKRLIYKEPAYRKDLGCCILNVPQMSSDEKRCIKYGMPVFGVAILLTIGVTVYVGNIVDQPRPLEHCTTDLSSYPVCGSTTSQGVSQNQAVNANILGNILRIGPKGTPNHLIYGPGYCQKTPARTVCTNFDPSQHKNISQECSHLKGGKLISVVTANNQTQEAYFVHNKENDCRGASELVERALKNSRTSYCKLNPEDIGFTIQHSQPILLTLFLIAANQPLPVVSPERWTYPKSLNEIEGPMWGADKNCYATWSSNVDPSAKKEQKQKREVERKDVARNLLVRKNMKNKPKKYAYSKSSQY